MAQLFSLGIIYTMRNLPPDTRGLRQMIYVCLIAFVVGFFAVLATLGCLIARFVAPEPVVGYTHKSAA